MYLFGKRLARDHSFVDLFTPEEAAVDDKTKVYT